MQIEKYIADKITSLCEKRDISKYRLSQFFQEGNSENLIEEQEEVLMISVNIDYRSCREFLSRHWEESWRRKTCRR